MQQLDLQLKFWVDSRPIVLQRIMNCLIHFLNENRIMAFKFCFVLCRKYFNMKQTFIKAVKRTTPLFNRLFSEYLTIYKNLQTLKLGWFDSSNMFTQNSLLIGFFFFLLKRTRENLLSKFSHFLQWCYLTELPTT